MIDILLSTIPGAEITSEIHGKHWKRRIFHAILDEEMERLPRIANLIASLRAEIDAAIPPDS